LLRRFSTLLVCAFGLFALVVRGQALSIKPIQFESGTILNFHLQTRLQASAGDPLNSLPSGTALQVKMLGAAHRIADADGVPFRGTVVSSIIVGDHVVIHSEAEVHGIQILLRNRNHPEGFRYELLITDLIDQGTPYTITASFDPTFAETNGEPLPGNSHASSANGDGTGVAVNTKSEKSNVN